MKTQLFLRQWSRDRMEANGLGIILFRYADWLEEKGYSRNTIHQYTQAVEHFGFWRGKRSSDRITSGEVGEFLAEHLPLCRCPMPCARTVKICRAALNKLISMLGSKVARSKIEDASSPISSLIVRFDRHLDEVMGLSVSTRQYRRRYSREFLEWRFKGRRLNLRKLSFADFVRYLNFRTPGLQRTSITVLITSLRSLTRFLEFQGHCPDGISQAWPTVPSWSLSPPRDVLSKKQSKQLVYRVKRSSSSRLRDESIVRLMMGLGLRCSEVVELELEDIDWRSGTLAVRKNKQRRERLLPLPPSIGKAIAAYLQKERPTSSSGRLFVCRGYLSGQPMTPERVRGPVRRALHHLLFLFLYNTGARVSEAITTRLQDVQRHDYRAVQLMGKGRKQRLVPLWQETRHLIRSWEKFAKLKCDQPLMPNRFGRQMTRTAVQQRLQLMVKAAQQTHPSLRHKHISPHTIRHTTAMHMLQSGVATSVISLWLGHEDPVTTHQYVEADLMMKENALSHLQPPQERHLRFRPQPDLLKFLDNLRL